MHSLRTIKILIPNSLRRFALSFVDIISLKEELEKLKFQQIEDLESPILVSSKIQTLTEAIDMLVRQLKNLKLLVNINAFCFVSDNELNYLSGSAVQRLSLNEFNIQSHVLQLHGKNLITTEKNY